jgi:hypothetical protein
VAADLLRRALPRLRLPARIEPQGRDGKTKKVSWPVYLTSAVKATKVPRAILVVICWDLTAPPAISSGSPTKTMPPPDVTFSVH